MNWLLKLFETYEQCVGPFSLQAVSHTTQQAHIEVVLGGEGNFLRAKVLDKADSVTLIPCTEESAGRTRNTQVSHPLCDKLQYVAGDFAEYGCEAKGFADNPSKPFETFVGNLGAWAGSPQTHEKVRAIYKYVCKKRLIADLLSSGILDRDGEGVLAEWQGNKADAPAIFRVVSGKATDAFVRWRVETSGAVVTGTWEDQDLIQAWVSRYANLQTRRGICMVTGAETTLAVQHPAKIRHAADKAKLISSNDKDGFTFLGRFGDSQEACAVSFEASQKAHIALRWLISRQSFRSDTLVVVAWATRGKRIPDPLKNTFELFDRSADATQERFVDSGQALGLRLAKLIAGYSVDLGSTDQVAVMGLDSATPGRMAIAFFRELRGADFLGRVQRWHETVSWQHNYGRQYHFIGAPSPRDVAEAAYGPRLDSKLQKATVERLLPCIIDSRDLPGDLVESVVRRASKRITLKQWEWEKTLGIACALFRGFHHERKYQMDLERDRKSRDYLFGRLLALADHIEARALYLAGESRDTTAAKLMQRFADRPSSTWRTMELSLVPYMSRLKAKRPGYLQRLKTELDEIVASFESEDFVNDRKLSGEFLLGFHCQRRVLNLPTNTESADEQHAEIETV